jgi:Mce-associated membrane protein
VTRVLAVLTLGLCVSIAAEAWYLWGVSSPTPTAARPVVIGDIDARAAVDTAAQDAARIFTTTWRGYGAHLARVTPLMTDRFAAQYRSSAGPVQRRIVASRTSTSTRVAGSGVLEASPDRVVALVFLDQRTVAHGAAPSYDARRALLTMVHSDRGWLVDNVQTQ